MKFASDLKQRPLRWKGRFCFVLPLTIFLLSPVFALEPADRGAIWTQVWERLNAQFVGFDNVSGLSWRREYSEGMAALKAAESDVQFWRELRRRIARLENGRTAIKFPVGLPRELDTVPLRLEYIDQRIYVKKLSSQVQLLSSGIRIGDELLTVDGIAASAVLDSVAIPQTSGSNLRARRALAVQRLFTGIADSPLVLGLRRPSGEQYETHLLRDSGLNGQFLNDLDEYPPQPVRELAPGVIYVDCFAHLVPNTEQVILEQMSIHADAKGLILDFRESRIGVLFDDVIARLSSTPLVVEAGSMLRAQLSQGTDIGALDIDQEWIEFAGRTVLPQAPQFQGKVIVLTTALTAGPAEEFLHALGERVTIVGDVTAGAAHQIAVVDLKEGAALTYAVVKPEWGGGLGDGEGLAPHVRALATAAGMAAGKDELLERALELVR